MNSFLQNNKCNQLSQLIILPNDLNTKMNSDANCCEIVNNDVNASPQGGSECVICFDTIQVSANNCRTICGHSFCFSCIATAMRTSAKCPLCRCSLINGKPESEEDADEEDIEDSDDEDGEYEDDDDDEEEDDNDCPENVIDIDAAVARFTAMGYTMKDAFVMLLNKDIEHKWSEPDRARYTDEHLTKIYDDYNRVVEEQLEIQRAESAENKQMELEDRVAI